MLSWLILTVVLTGPVPAIQGAHPLELRLELEPALAALEAAGKSDSGNQAIGALLRAADLAEALGRPDRAAAALLRAAGRLSADPRSPGWRLRAGDRLLELGDTQAVRDAVSPLVAIEGPGRLTRAERVQARLLLGRADLADGRVRRGRERLAKVISAWDGAQGPTRLELSAPAAEAALQLARLDSNRLAWDYPASQAPRILEPWLKKRLTAIQRVSEGFDGVFRFGSLRHSVYAAMERARLLIRLQQWLWDFPPPPGLDPELYELYRQQLSDYSSTFEDQAMELLEKVTFMVAEHHLAADAGRQARGGLERLEPKLHWWRLRRPPLPVALPVDPDHPRWPRVSARLSRAPGDRQALLLAAEGYLVDHRPTVAVYVLQRLMAPSTEQRLLLVRALEAAGDLERAYPLACALTRDFPGLVPAWRQRAELEFAFGDLDGAGSSLAALERLGDAQVELRAGRAVVLVGQAELSAAREMLESLVAATPGRADLHNDLALVLMAAGRQSGAPAERIALVRRAAGHLELAQGLSGGRDPDIIEHRRRAAATLRALEAALGEARQLAPSREEL